MYLDTVSMWVVETVSIFAALIVVQTIVAVWVELVSCDTLEVILNWILNERLKG